MPATAQVSTALKELELHVESGIVLELTRLRVEGDKDLEV